MDLNTPLTAARIADMVGGTALGNTERLVTGINEINRVREGDLVFVDHEKYYTKALNSAATTILINKDDVTIPEGKAIILCVDPCAEYNKLVRHFAPRQAWDSASPTVGEGTEIHPSAVIGANVKIGAGCLISPGVVIHQDTTIGDRVIIHANTVIGADSFYYKKRPSGYDKMATGGCVVIEDDVEIGALCTIDRGLSADTRIGAGTKIDNHVQVGHDTLIGKQCLIASQVGISGCCVVEDGVTLWGQVGIPSKLRIGKGATLLGQTGILSDVEAGRTYFGSPAGEVKVKLREIALIKRLPELLKKLDQNG